MYHQSCIIVTCHNTVGHVMHCAIHSHTQGKIKILFRSYSCSIPKASHRLHVKRVFSRISCISLICLAITHDEELVYTSHRVWASCACQLSHTFKCNSSSDGKGSCYTRLIINHCCKFSIVIKDLETTLHSNI